jgi:hypothetical protein
MTRKRILVVHDPEMTAVSESTLIMLRHGYDIDVIETKNWWNNFRRRTSPMPAKAYQTITAALRNDLQKKHYDEVLIDGALAYDLRLRNALKGISLDSTLLVGTTQFISGHGGDVKLCVSGCDFAHSSIPSAEQLADHVLQTPIPAIDWLVHNPKYWRVETGIYVRK